MPPRREQAPGRAAGGTGADDDYAIKWEVRSQKLEVLNAGHACKLAGSLHNTENAERHGTHGA